MAIDKEFLLAYFSILVQCKTIGAVGAVIMEGFRSGSVQIMTDLDPDPDPRGPKTYGSYGSETFLICFADLLIQHFISDGSGEESSIWSLAKDYRKEAVEYVTFFSLTT